MAINVTLGEVKTQNNKPFPKLMKWNKPERELVVLFQSLKSGTVLFSTSIHWRMGDASDDFDMSQFTDYNEPITLQNQ